MSMICLILRDANLPLISGKEIKKLNLSKLSAKR
jgi:hypothetical protein